MLSFQFCSFLVKNSFLLVCGLWNTIEIGRFASSVPRAVLPLANVNLTTGPGLLASSVLRAVLPLALVNLTIGEGTFALSVGLVVLELALVNRATG